MSELISSTTMRSFQDRAGGPWVVSYRSFILNSLLSSLSLFIMEKIFERTFLQALGIMIAWCIAILITGLLVLLAALTLLRNRHTKPVSLPVVLCTNMFYGVVYTLTLFLVMESQNIESSIGLFGLLIGNSLLTTWWGLYVAVLLDYWEELKIEKVRLIEKASQSLVLRFQQREFTNAIVREIESEVREELAPLRREISNELQNIKFDGPLDEAAPASKMAEIPKLLRDGANLAVRPLSKKLWGTIYADYPSTPFRNIISNIWNKQPFRPLLLVGIDFAGTAFEQFGSFGVGRGMQLLLVMWLMIYVFSLSFNLLMNKFPQWHSRIFFLGMCALQSTVIIRGNFREHWQPGSVTLNWQITEVVLGIFVILFTSGFGAFKDINEQVRRTFESEIEFETLKATVRSQQIAIYAKESAQILHGSIQTKLVVCAMEIERANKEKDPVQLSRVLNEALTILTTPLSTPVVPATLNEEIERKVSLWKGFCDFEVKVNNIRCSSAAAQMVGRIVEEGISNAIRHGGASKIFIEVKAVNLQILEICLIDDGHFVQSSTPGMGTAIIEQASAGKWSLNRLGSETILKVLLPSSEMV